VTDKYGTQTCTFDRPETPTWAYPVTGISSFALGDRDSDRVAANVFSAHIDIAFEIKQRGHRGSCHAVLPRAGLGNDPLLAHAAGEQTLPDGVVDLVRPGVIEIFALQIDFRAAKFFRQSSREIKPRGPADIVAKIRFELADEARIGLGPSIFRIKLLKRGHQRFGHKNAPIRTEMSGRIGKRSERGTGWRRHGRIVGRG